MNEQEKTTSEIIIFHQSSEDINSYEYYNKSKPETVESGLLKKFEELEKEGLPSIKIWKAQLEGEEPDWEFIAKINPPNGPTKRDMNWVAAWREGEMVGHAKMMITVVKKLMEENEQLKTELKRIEEKIKTSGERR